MNKFQKRVNKVKEHLRGMIALESIMRGKRIPISERELKKDARWTVKEILKDNPNWLNEKW